MSQGIARALSMLAAAIAGAALFAVAMILFTGGELDINGTPVVRETTIFQQLTDTMHR